MKVETPERNPDIDAIVELLKKSAEFIKDKSKQAAKGWVTLNDFINDGSTEQEKRNRKRAFTTLRTKYSGRYEYKEIARSGERVSKKMRAKSQH